MAAALPTMMVVFFCQTVAGHSGVVGAKNWQDREWLTDEMGLKICRPVYKTVEDLTKKFQFDRDRPVPVNIDISDPMQCAFVGMQVEAALTEDPDEVWYSYKRGCPHKTQNEKGDTIYVDPPCPPDCKCENDPHEI